MWLEEQLDCSASLALAAVIGEILLRTFKVWYEYNYFQSNYVPGNRLKIILKRAMVFNAASMFFMVLTMILTRLFSIQLNTLIIAILWYVAINTLGLHKSDFDLSDWIRQPMCLDYAEGMAHSYFHGYLKLAISARERTDHNIRARMRLYSASEGVMFAKECLFILIPDDMFCAPVINSKLLERAQSLETVVLDRAGVQRPYKNDVYRFTEKILGKTYYIALEGATPIQTFYEAMENHLTSTPKMTEMKREILLKFSKTLKRLIRESEDMTGLVEVILYHNKQGERTDVGEILKEHVEEYLKSQDPLNGQLHTLQEHFHRE